MEDCSRRDIIDGAARRQGRGDDPGMSAKHAHASQRGAWSPRRQEYDAVLIIAGVKTGGLREIAAEDVSNRIEVGIPWPDIMKG